MLKSKNRGTHADTEGFFEIPLNTSFVNKMKPLSKSKIESINIADYYWINSPLKKEKKE